MSRSRLHPRAVLSAAALSTMLFATACSDSTGPSSEEDTAPTSSTEAPGGSDTSAAIDPEVTGTEGVAAVPGADKPAFAYSVATLPNLRGCFKWSTGAAYKAQRVYILYWTGSAWARVKLSSGVDRARTTDAYGCVQFDDVPVGKYLALQAYTQFGFPTCQVWQGASNYIGPTAKNDVVWNVGTSIVSMTLWGTPDYYSQVCLNWR